MWVEVATVILTLCAIFAFAQQEKGETGELSARVERWLMRVVPPTGTGSMGEATWMGLTVRSLAHVVEFAVLGAAVGSLCVRLFGIRPKSVAIALVFCLVASLADEFHKTFVPGRHFDAQDLVLDAVAYVCAVLMTFLIALVVKKIRG